MLLDRAIKVAVLLPSLQIGGAERLVLEELAYMKNDSRFFFELHLVFEEGPLFDQFLSLGLQIRVWKAPHKSVRMLKSYKDIVQYLRRAQFDILHSHLLDGIGPIVGKLAGVRVVTTAHSDKKYGVIERYALSRCDLALGCGTQVLRNISGFIPSEKINVLSNAIRKPDKIHFEREEVLENKGIKQGSRLVVSLGRLKKAKGYDVLIEAFRQVLIEVPDAVLFIGGDGEEKNRLKSIVLSSGLGENIKLPGIVTDIDDILAACELYVNSSRWEGLPMTLLEAMAHGKPMIATNVGGNVEVVSDGVTGILVPPEDPEMLAGAIIRMLKDDNFRESAGNAAFALFKNNYTIDKHCKALADHYLQLMQ